MITIKLQISETNDGKIEFKASGGNVGGTSKLEREFAKKFLAYANRFNTTFTKCRSKSRFVIREVKDRKSQEEVLVSHGNKNRNRT